jgi:hypothetical protein
VSVTREELAAFGDGELDPDRARAVGAAVADDPILAEQLLAHRRLRERLVTHFGPILAAPVPERLTMSLRPPSEVIDLSLVRAQRMRRVARWSWIAGPALAASIALGVFLSRGGDYAQGPLEAALETQLVAQQSGQEPIRILLTFRDKRGDYCRAFAAQAQSGIACRDERGWLLRMTEAGARSEEGEYRTAGVPAANVLEAAQRQAAGPALAAGDEQRARAHHWR